MNTLLADMGHRQRVCLREAAKKVLFLVARPLRPRAPPLDLVAIETIFLTLNFFFSVAHPFSPPPPLSGPATKKRTLFAASPRSVDLIAARH